MAIETTTETSSIVDGVSALPVITDVAFLRAPILKPEQAALVRVSKF